MFYSQHVLTRKGPLAKIWLAAHMQSKLTKAMVFATDLRQAIETILQPPAPMALRLTSNLLLGVARILHRKTKYLLQESADALTKLKLTFRPTTSVDLPASSAPNFAAVTLAEGSVDGLAAPMVDLSLIPRSKSGGGGSTSAFLASDRDITIDEFAGGLAGGMLDAFGMTDDLELERENVWDADASNEPLLFTPSQRGTTSRRASVKDAPMADDNLEPDKVTPVSVELMRAAADDGDLEEHEPVLSVERTDGAEGKSRESEGVDGSDGVQGLATTGNVEETPREKEEVGTDVEMLRENVDEGISPPQLGTPPPVDEPLSAGARLSIGEPLSLGTPSASEAAPNLEPGSVAEDNDPLVGADVAAPTAAGGPGNDLSPNNPMLQVDATPEVADVPRLSTGSVGFQLTEGEEAAEAAEEEKAKAEMHEMAEGVEEPIDSPLPSKRGRKRKRTLVEDPATELTVEAFRAILTDTSDLVYGPNERRRGGERVRRAPLRFQEVLARPAVVMAPELSELFAASFRLDDTREVGSPMSDADLEREKDADENGRGEKSRDAEEKVPEVGEEDEEEQQVVKPDGKGEETKQALGPDEGQTEQSPGKESASEVAKTPLPLKSPGLDLPGLSPEGQLRAEAMGNIEISSGGFASTEKPTTSSADKNAGPEKRMDVEGVGGSQVAVSQSTARRLSFFTEDPAATPQLEEAEPVDVGYVVDSNKVSLRDVANTRSQVAEENGGGGEQDVTETTVSARTRKMQEYIREHVDDDEELDFSKGLEMEPHISRRIAARTFYELLNLSSKKALILRQDGAYGGITAKPVHPMFDSLAQVGTAE